MNSNINGIIKNNNYSLEDAFEIIKASLGDSFQIINSIILSQKKEYDDNINSMNKKIVLLNKQIDQLNLENSQLKNTILQLQNKLITLSTNLKQLSKGEENEDKKRIDNKYINIKQNNLYKHKQKVSKIQNEMIQELNEINSNNNNILDKIDVNYMNNEIYNMNKQTIDLDQIKKSINQQLFNKKFKMKKEKTFSKGFNLTNKDKTPTRVVQKGKENTLFIKENESQSSNSLENNYNKQQSNTISNMNHRRKTFNNFMFRNTVIQNEMNQKDKFNLIAKRIKHLKNGLSINNSENNNDNIIRFNTTYSLNRRNNSNLKNINSFDNY